MPRFITSAIVLLLEKAVIVLPWLPEAQSTTVQALYCNCRTEANGKSRGFQKTQRGALLHRRTAAATAATCLSGLLTTHTSYY